MQESRLFRIVYYLLEKGKTTAPALARRFEVSVRTIYRDIDTISSAGIPIYAMQGKGGGIAISEDFVLEKSLLSRTEKEKILMALQGLAATEAGHEDELLTKLGSLFRSQITSWIEVDFSSWRKKHPSNELFARLKSAIFSKHPVSFQYYGSNPESMARQVEPYKLVFKSKDWYLYGFCLLRKDFRFFKLTRIQNLQIQSGSCCTRSLPAAPLASRLAGMEKTILVKLKFQKEMAFRVYDEFADAATEDAQGCFYVQAYLPDHDTLYSYLLSFAEYVEVLEPPAVRRRIKEKLTLMRQKYET